MAKKSTAQDGNPHNLEQTLEQLEQLVQRMETGEQSLDAALADFEAGIKLVRGCRDNLEQAEQRVQILLADNSTPSDLDAAAVEPDDNA